MKASQILRNATRGTSLAEIMILLEPMKQTPATNQVAMFVINEIVNYTKADVSIKQQNDFCRRLLIEVAQRYEKYGN